MKKQKRKPESSLGKIWYFIWEDDSILSWLVNIVLAFIIIKFLIYPGLGLALGGTTHPVVAVVSGSMEHKIARNGFGDQLRLCNATYTQKHHIDFDEWWNTCSYFYKEKNITKKEFLGYKFKSGFNKGDIMVLYGSDPENIKIGDVIVFMSDKNKPKADPIIHRAIKVWKVQGKYHFQTKGDHNPKSINACEPDGCINEYDIDESQIVGKAVLRIPYIGWIKIMFVDILRLII